jgi:hypothetical protein
MAGWQPTRKSDPPTNYLGTSLKALHDKSIFTLLRIEETVLINLPGQENEIILKMRQYLFSLLYLGPAMSPNSQSRSDLLDFQDRTVAVYSLLRFL